MNELNNNIIQWAKNRGIHYPENAKNQLLKSFEEMGELSSSLIKGDQAGVKDAIGDVIVTLIILSSTQGTSIKECLELAWNEIKDRKGKTINGTFIKESDGKY